ncbi:unnamed protein product [Chrysoparadoxa australica]
MDPDPSMHYQFTDEDEQLASRWKRLKGRELVKSCRQGIPIFHRGGVWNKLVSQSSESAGTPSHKMQQEGVWLRVMTKVFGKKGTFTTMPNFGGELRLQDHMLTFEGAAAVRKILTAVKHMLAVEWCPALLDIVPLLLVVMPEACVYNVVDDLWQERPLFFPVSSQEYLIWVATYRDLVAKFYPSTFNEMEACGALEPQHLQVLFDRLFVSLLRPQHVVLVWDAWLCEGAKVLFRYGLALLKLFRKRLKVLRLKPGQGEQWWNYIRDWTHESSFDFDKLRSRAFSLKTRSFRPLTWAMLEYYHDRNEKQLQHASKRPSLNEVEVKEERQDDAQPFFWPPFQMATSFPPPALLNEPASRGQLVRWVPEILRHKKLRVVFTTEIYGYSLDLLYSHCRAVAPSLLVVESLEGAIFGGFCSDPWQPTNTVYGNGQCFLFTLKPKAAIYRWGWGGAKAGAGQGQGQGHQQGGVGAGDEKQQQQSKKRGRRGLKGAGDTAADMSPHREVLERSSHGGRGALSSNSSSRHVGSRHFSGHGSKNRENSNSRHRGHRHLLHERSKHRGSNAVDVMGLSSHKYQAATEAFMMATRDFIAMGSSSLTTNCGLKLMNDLSTGHSDVCETFANGQLAGALPCPSQLAPTCTCLHTQHLQPIPI